MQKISLWLALCGLGTACVARNDLSSDQAFALKTRILQLERKVGAETTQDSKKGVGSLQKPGLASMNNSLEEIRAEQQRMLGDIDALKNGLNTGAIEGELKGGTVADALTLLLERVKALETTQAGLLQVVNKKPKKRVARGRKKLKDARRVRQAFKARKYKHVTEDVPSILTEVGEKSAVS